MRSFEDILKAKDSVATSENTLTVADLLPGYLVGGSLEFISEVAYIAPVAAAVQGKRIEISEKIRLEDCYWEVKKLNNYRYYVYLDTLAVLHVDVRAPMIINKMMGLYHPSTGWRYINTFYSNNVGRITETTVSTLNIIGYSGDGTPYAPQEGDRRVYIDEDEIRFEEYTGGAWTSVNSIVIGGADSYGNFLPFIGCRGVYNTLGDPPENVGKPTAPTEILDFELGVTTDLGTVFTNYNGILSASLSKFGTNSFMLDNYTTSHNHYVRSPNPYIWTGGSISAGAYLYVPSGCYNSAAAVDAAITVIGLTPTSNSNAIYIGTKMSVGGELRPYFGIVSDDVTIVSEYGDPIPANIDAWGFYAFAYDAVAEVVHFIVNSTVHSYSLPGAIDQATPNYVEVNGQSDSGIATVPAIDEFFIVDGFAGVDTLLQYYAADAPWDSTYSASDFLIKPAPGGVVNVLEGGPHGETGNIFDLVWPIGCTYTQYPGKASPTELKLPGTWENISSEFAGDFFRAEGGNASDFESGEQTHMFETHVHNHRHSLGKGPWGGGSGMTVQPGINASYGTMYTAYSTNSPTSGNYGAETRPVNRTIRIWERTA